MKSRTASVPEVTESLLAEIVRRIVSAGDPVKIVLFGSRARADHLPDSDIGAVTKNGAAYCWGFDNRGELGGGPLNQSGSKPVLVVEPL